jgi:hypothetical protein
MKLRYLFNFFKDREQRKWGYGTNPQHEIQNLTSIEILLNRYI